MDHHLWYYRYKVPVAWLNSFIEDVERADRDLVLNLTETTGVGDGFDVTQKSGGQNFSVDISAGLGYDDTGRRFYSGGTINLAFVTDDNGNPITVTTAGKDRIVSIYAEYALVDDPGSLVVDGFGNTVPTIQTEQVAFRLFQGAEANSGTAVAPADPGGNLVRLADVTIHFNDLTISNADINNNVKEYLSFALGLQVVNDFNINWGFGAGQVSAIDVPIADAGNLYTATEVENALQEVMTIALNAYNQVNAFTYTGTGAIVRQNSPTINTPTINTPTITVFTNMNHTHLNAAQGGVLSGNAITSVITGTGNVVKATAPTISNPTLTSPNIAFNDFQDMNHAHTSTFTGGALDGSAIQTNITGSGAVVKSVTPTLSTPTLTTPVIANYTNAQHDHSSAVEGGSLAASAVTAHQASLTILETQITNGTLLARVADNETITGSWIFTATSNPTTDGQLRRQSLAKAYAKVNTTAGTVFTSYNVTSVTKTGTGRVTLTFANAFNSTNEIVPDISVGYNVNSGVYVANYAFFDASNIDINCHQVLAAGGNPATECLFDLTVFGNLG